ncbi:uncharacterized protein RAG0_09610 [Rhynchosporium agropyri]|uniref:Uncharacterized protein n=1 Tax=Rhynchosporium agropyri TaxID=914238 RepID=A0A1E1KW78_9HELO|nr:uncharacterized protein RAG0_09610 [Rhynchosporium agropyri]
MDLSYIGSKFLSEAEKRGAVGIESTSTSPELQSHKLHRELRSSLNSDKSSDGNEYIPPSRAYRASDQGCLRAAEAKVPTNG